ncbi:MAG TPA: hypothetical protein PKA90_13640 [Ignavibacteria bacterium]|nr:hypothetical protein [Ignavibacteria bacterium]HMR41462.1 hypothetical protein [Ignavibacteria bacterium]
MKYIFCLLGMLFYSIGHCQIKESYNFKFSVSKGITYNFNNLIFEREEPLSSVASQYSVDLTDIEIGYFIFENHEIGLSIGTNLFTQPESNFKTSYQIETNGDTVFTNTSGYKYVDLTWISLYYNFHFLKNYKAGFKIGNLKPTNSNYDYYNYFSLMVGKNYKITNNFLVDIDFIVSSRSILKQLEFKSWQINLCFGVNLYI